MFFAVFRAQLHMRGVVGDAGGIVEEKAEVQGGSHRTEAEVWPVSRDPSRSGSQPQAPQWPPCDATRTGEASSHWHSRLPRCREGETKAKVITRSEEATRPLLSSFR